MSRKTISVNVDVDVDLDDILREYDVDEILGCLDDKEIAEYVATRDIKIRRAYATVFANELKELCLAYRICYTKQDLINTCTDLIQLTNLP